MGWERGQYYTRSHKVGGAVVRQYVGGGPLAALVAQIDADRRAERDGIAACEAALDDLDGVIDLVARGTLAAAGYHRPKRGPWRKKRGRTAGGTDPGPGREVS